MEMYNLPIGLRNWFTESIQKASKFYEEEKKEMDKAMRKR